MTVHLTRRRGPHGTLAEADYARHEPEKTLLHEVIRAELVPFLALSRSEGAPVARSALREVRAYLECGVLAHGFLRVHCDACGRDRLVAFACKGRGFCPSCGGRSMADTATHLVDRVLPEVPIRQWVLTLPCPLRYRCAWNARLTSEVLRCFLRSVFADQQKVVSVAAAKLGWTSVVPLDLNGDGRTDLLVPQALLLLEEEPVVRTRWYLLEVGRRGGDDVLYAGVYHDELAVHDGQWRFRRRRFDLLYARTGAGALVPPLPAVLGAADDAAASGAEDPSR